MREVRRPCSWGNTAIQCYTPEPHRQINSLIDTADTSQWLCKINNWSPSLALSLLFFYSVFVSRFSFGRSLCMPSTFIHYYNYVAACRSLVISDRGVWDNRDSGRPQHALAGMRARRKTPAPTAADHSHWLSKSTSKQDIVAGSHITGTILRKRTKADNHNLLHTLWQFFPSWDLLIGCMRPDLDQNWLMFEVCSRWTDPQIYEWCCVATDFWLGCFPQSSLHPVLTFGYCDSPLLLSFQVWFIQALTLFQLFLIKYILKKVNFIRIWDFFFFFMKSDFGSNLHNFRCCVRKLSKDDFFIN